MKRIFITFFVLISFALTAQESAKLEYNLNKGDVYKIEMVLDQDMAPIMQMNIGMTMMMNITGLEGNNIKSTYQMKRILMKMSSQDEVVEFDSDKKNEDLSEEEKKMKAEITPALEMILYQTIDKSGKIVNQKMVPELKEANSMLNQNQFTNMEYPKTIVKVGSTWDFGQNLNGMNMKMTYTVTKITNDIIFTDIIGSMAGMADAKVGGKLEIDRESGMISIMNLDIGMVTGGINMNMNVKFKTSKI